MKNQYIVYCDGAYSSTTNKSGAGLIILKNNKPIFEYSKTFKGGTNNTAEICAIILALKCFKKPVDSIIIVSDSQYCLGIINNNWSRKANISLWNEFDKVYANALTLCDDIRFVWTKGHSSDPGNKRADYLAVRATKAYE